MIAELVPYLFVFFAGISFGCFSMGLLQYRHSKKQKKEDFERLGNSIHASEPRRWNGRYPRDAERSS